MISDANIQTFLYFLFSIFFLSSYIIQHILANFERKKIWDILAVAMLLI